MKFEDSAAVDHVAPAEVGDAPRIRLYVVAASHPCIAVELMLAHKGMAYRSVELPSVASRVILRGLGFPGKTVPAMHLDGDRVQGSLIISRTLDSREPRRPLFPADPRARDLVETAETFGEELQNLARRVEIWGLLRDRSGVELQLRASALPIPPRLGARLAGPSLHRLQKIHGATDAAVRRDLVDLPGMLDQLDQWIEQEVIGDSQPNAADYQIAPSISLLMTMEDLRPQVEGRPIAALASRLVPDYPAHIHAGVFGFNREVPRQST